MDDNTKPSSPGCSQQQHPKHQRHQAPLQDLDKQTLSTGQPNLQRQQHRRLVKKAPPPSAVSGAQPAGRDFKRNPSAPKTTYISNHDTGSFSPATLHQHKINSPGLANSATAFATPSSPCPDDSSGAGSVARSASYGRLHVDDEHIIDVQSEIGLQQLTSQTLCRQVSTDDANHHDLIVGRLDGRPEGQQRLGVNDNGNGNGYGYGYSYGNKEEHGSKDYMKIDHTKDNVSGTSPSQHSTKRPIRPPPPLHSVTADARLITPRLRQSASFAAIDPSEMETITPPRSDDNDTRSPRQRYSDEAAGPKSGKKKGGFSSFMNSMLGSPRRPPISAPENPVHVTHVGYDNETGQFTVRQAASMLRYNCCSPGSVMPRLQSSCTSDHGRNREPCCPLILPCPICSAPSSFGLGSFPLTVVAGAAERVATDLTAERHH